MEKGAQFGAAQELLNICAGDELVTVGCEWRETEASTEEGALGCRKREVRGYGDNRRGRKRGR